MAYIGKQPGTGVRNRFLYTATAGQTTFTTSDSNLALSYSDALYMDVYLNGVLLDPANDYTATSGTSVVLGSGATAGDVLEIVVYDVFSVFNNTIDGNFDVAGNTTLDNNVTVGGDLTISDKIIHSGDTNTAIRFPAADAVTIETGGSERARVASDGKIGIGITSPEALTHIAGATADADGALGSMSPQLIIEGGNNNNPFELGMDNSGATAVAFLQSRNKSAGAQSLALNPAGGNVYIGRTSGNPTTSEFGLALKATGHSFISRDTNGTGTTLRVFGNAGEGRIMGDGDLQNTNNNYGAISDETLKQDIVDAASQWDDIKDIRVRKFRFKDNPEGALQIGVIAQELEASGMNGLVKEVMSNEEDENSEETVKSVKYSVLYMKAIKALQEAMERIEALETKVAALEAE